MSLESFRPVSLGEVVGQETAVKVLRGMVERTRAGGSVPHLLFHGPPGVGKTTAALATIRELLGPAWRDNTLEMNASSDRGIDVVRTRIIPWVGTMPQNASFKALFLDECDSMTTDAQSALRRIMETGANTTRFFLACNKLSKVIEPIQSRCLSIGFRPLSDRNLHDILINVASKEKLPEDAERVQSAITHSRGDARRAIHLFMDGGEDGDAFLALDNEVAQLFSGTGSASARIEKFIGFLRTTGLSEWEEILAAIAEVVLSDKVKMTDNEKADVMVGIGACAFRCNSVAVPILQIRSGLYGMVK